MPVSRVRFIPQQLPHTDPRQNEFMTRRACALLKFCHTGVVTGTTVHIASGIQKSSPMHPGIVDCLERLSYYPLPQVVKTESEGNPGINELLRNNDSMLII